MKTCIQKNTVNYRANAKYKGKMLPNISLCLSLSLCLLYVGFVVAFLVIWNSLFRLVMISVLIYSLNPLNCKGFGVLQLEDQNRTGFKIFFF